MWQANYPVVSHGRAELHSSRSVTFTSKHNSDLQPQGHLGAVFVPVYGWVLRLLLLFFLSLSESFLQNLLDRFLHLPWNRITDFLKVEKGIYEHVSWPFWHKGGEVSSVPTEGKAEYMEDMNSIRAVTGTVIVMSILAQ